jgi:hypothetical protein
MAYQRLTVVVVVVALACLIACFAIAGVQKRAGTSLPPIPALDLPRAMATTAAPPTRIEWDARALAAARMYFPTEMPVFEVIPSLPNRDMALQLSALLGNPIPEDTVRQLPEKDTNESFYLMNLGKLNLDYFCDGNYGVIWNDREPYSKTPPIGEEAVGVDEATAAAEKFLAETGLLPEGARVTEVVPTGLRTTYDSTVGRDRTLVLVRSVTYRRFWNGFPEGSFSVGVNNRGQVCSLKRTMRDVKLIGAYPILSPEEASAAIGSVSARIEGLPSSGSFVNGVITEAQLEYFDGATGWRMQTIQPVYRLTGVTMNWTSRRKTQFYATVPAVRPEFLAPVQLPNGG